MDLKKLWNNVAKFKNKMVNQGPQEIISPLPVGETLTPELIHWYGMNEFKENRATAEAKNPVAPQAPRQIKYPDWLANAPSPEQRQRIDAIRNSPTLQSLGGLTGLSNNQQFKIDPGIPFDISKGLPKGLAPSQPISTPTPTPTKAPMQPIPGTEKIVTYTPIIMRAAKENNLDPITLAGALARESMQFNDKFVSGYHLDGTGRGIAGIDKKWNPQVTDEQAFDPEFSINWMAKQLASLRDAEGGDMYNALRRYNGGPAYNSQRIGFDGVSTVDELTRKHADMVMNHAQRYSPYFQ